ncbi:hypothetical protein KAU32_04345, partial [bacterium]|nr:hypothetical protein [bacterium]
MDQNTGMSLKRFKTLLGWSPGEAGLPVSGCGKGIKKGKVSSRGSWRPWDPVLFHPGSHFTPQTAFIVVIDSNLSIPLSMYL